MSHCAWVEYGEQCEGVGFLLALSRVPSNPTHVVWLSSNHLYSLSHLTGPEHIFLASILSCIISFAV